MPDKPRRDLRLGPAADGDARLDHAWQVYFEEVQDYLEEIEKIENSAVIAYKATTQAIGLNSETKITWSDTDKDSGENMDLANNDYIVPFDGYYRVAGPVMITGGADGNQVILKIYSDTGRTSLVRQFYAPKQGTSFNTINFSDKSYYQEGDEINLAIINTVSAFTVHNALVNTAFSVQYLHR